MPRASSASSTSTSSPAPGATQPSTRTLPSGCGLIVTIVVTVSAVNVMVRTDSVEALRAPLAARSSWVRVASSACRASSVISNWIRSTRPSGTGSVSS